MTPQQFTAWATATFGSYLPAMKLEVEKWLSTHTPFFVAALREIALREHPSVYGRPPGVHELEAWKVEAFSRGHTLEAIEAAKQYRPQLPSEIVDVVTEEEAEVAAKKLKEKWGGKV